MIKNYKQNYQQIHLEKAVQFERQQQQQQQQREALRQQERKMVMEKSHEREFGD